MKFSCTSIFLIVAMKGLTQEIKLAPALGFGVGSSDKRKIFFFSKELQLGIEASLGNLGVMSVSIAGATLAFTYTDSASTQVYLTRRSLMLPVALKNYKALSAQSSYYLELGCAPALQIGEHREARIDGEVRKERLPMSTRSLALFTGIGYKRAVDGTTSISLGLRNYLDLLVEQGAMEERLWQSRMLLNIVFYRKLISKPKLKTLEPL